MSEFKQLYVWYGLPWFYQLISYKNHVIIVQIYILTHTTVTTKICGFIVAQLVEQWIGTAN